MASPDRSDWRGPFRAPAARSIRPERAKEIHDQYYGVIDSYDDIAFTLHKLHSEETFILLTMEGSSMQKHFLRQLHAKQLIVQDYVMSVAQPHTLWGRESRTGLYLAYSQILRAFRGAEGFKEEWLQ